MKVNDAISGLIFVALAGAIFFFTRDFSALPGQDYGAAFFPRTIATLMALCGLILIVQGARARGAGPWAEAFGWMRSYRHAGNFVLVIAALLFYILVSDTLGFAITATLTLYALLLGLRGRTHWLSSAVIALVAMVAMQQFFGQFLRVPLPWGILEAYAW